MKCRELLTIIIALLMAFYFINYQGVSTNYQGIIRGMKDEKQNQVRVDGFTHVNIPDACDLFKQTRNNDLPFTPDLNLNVYPSRDGSKEFILCAYPKTGCTQWVMLLNFLSNGEHNPNKVHYTKNGRTNNTLQKNSKCLNSMEVPRILIMRYPYKRTVSSYHDFKRRNPDLSNITFEDFVFDHIKKGSESNQPRDHRFPISRGCSPSWAQGGWDYVFQLEQMSLWLPCTLEMLNLTHIVGSGWNNQSLFKAPDLSIGDALRIALNGGPKELVKSITSGHENNSTDLHTSATINIVNTIFRSDFVLGGYKLRG